MPQNSFEFLRSTPDDHDFHSQRVMFWIVDNKVEIGPKGTTMSHLEMAESRGWIDGTNNEQFFDKNSRGFYLKSGNRVHFYRGVGFGFDENLKTEILNILPSIRISLDLEATTDIYFGPKDSLIKGVEYPIERVGTVDEMLK